MAENFSAVVRLVNRCGDVHWHFSSAMFVQAGVLVAVLLCVDLLLRRRVRPVFRYWMWTLVLAKLVLPVTLVCPASPAYWLAATSPPQPALIAAAAVPRSVVPPAAEPVVPSWPDDTRLTVLPERVLEKPQARITAGQRGAAAASPTMAAPEAAAPAAIPRVPLRPTAWVFLAWLAVVSVLALLLGRRIARVRRLVQRAAPAAADLRGLLDECHGSLRLKPRLAELRISDELGSPAICGLWRPTILLPRALVDKLDRQQLRLVFLHELAHWRRGDLHVQWLQTALQIAYFYNPAVWIANTILRRLREQAVDETVLVAAGPQSDAYPSTLLDVAALALRPAELALRMTGVVESRRALAQRIHRMVSGRMPKSAKLGLAGIAVILVMGLVLLPMSGRDRSGAEQPDRAAAASAAAQSTASAVQAEAGSQPQAEPDQAFAPQGVLSGRITDETGAPVTGAEIELTDSYYRTRLKANSDEQGRYHFDEVPEPGEYHVRITSERWVGITRHDELPRIHLAPGSQVVRHFTLNRACRIRIQTVDRAGKPVRGVHVHAALLSGERWVIPESVLTDKEGWALIGGLKRSQADYLFATWCDDYGFAKLVLKLDDPEKVVSRQIVLDEGVEVRGTAVCSDGKPPAGWRVYAMPTWWDFGVWPQGAVIAADGSFTLPHVVADKYDVSILIPSGKTSWEKQVLSSVALPDNGTPLTLTLDHPSPGSMVSISGRIRYVGGPVKKGFWIFANSEDRRYHGSVYLEPGEEQFEIGPVPRALYNIQFESPEIESRTLRGIAAPAENLEVEITVSGKPALRGSVVRGDNGRPVGDFRFRVAKQRTLRGPNYVVEPRWHEVSSAEGRFEVEVPGPGIYVVQVAAEGFAWASSEPINTDEQADMPVRIELGEGVSLSGSVADEQGKPIDGARVVPLTKASGLIPAGALSGMAEKLPEAVVLKLFTTDDGAVKSVAGRFTIDRLMPGKEILKVTHPDYSLAIVQNVEVGGPPGADELKITLTQGGTVCGHVYDEEGKPAPNVTITFRNDEHGGAGIDEEAGRLATAVSDESGYYQARHLPEQICSVHRGDKWRTLGVTVQTILPQSGKTHALDFGGRSRLAGRLVVNGEPLSGAMLVLSEESPKSGVFRANAQTARDGSFTFWGPQPGKRTLYYAVSDRLTDWARVQDVLVTSRDLDLGTIDHVACRVVVRCASEDGGGLENLRVVLQEYNPIWPFGNQAGIELPRQGPGDPFVFDHVPAGKYELLAQEPDRFQARKIVEVTAADRRQEVTCTLPRGTASLSGKIDGAICGPGGCSALKAWSKDGSLLGYIIPSQDGTYRLDNVPPGDYLIREKDTRDAPVLLALSLADGEERTLDFTPAVVSSTSEPIGFLVVRVFTADGVPLPCDVELKGPAGTLSPHSSQYGRQGFAGPPGTYELSVDYPGFEPLRRTVELKAVAPDGRPAEGYEVRLHLGSL